MDSELKTYLDGMRQQIEGSFERVDVKLDTLEQRVDAKLDGFEQRVDAKIDGFEQRVDAKLDAAEQRLREHIDERTHDIETRLLRSYAAYNRVETVRMRKLEADVSNVNASSTQQLEAFNERLLEIEARILRLEAGGNQ